MLKFNNGYFGACICVLALLGTAISGFVLNVDQESREVTRYSYVADVSGLFSYSDAPEYISYNPSSNYTGYSPLGNVDFTESSTVNNYRFVKEDGTTTTIDTGSITNGTDYGTDYVKWNNGYVDAGTVVVYNDSSVSIGGSDPERFYPIYVNYYTQVPTLRSVLNNIAPGFNDYASVEVELSYDSTNPVFFYSGDWVYGETSVGQYTFGWWTAHFTDDNLPDKLSIDIASYLVSAYKNNVIVWQALIDDVGVFNKYAVVGVDLNTSTTTYAGYTVNGKTYPTYGYMQPNAGVKASSWENWATWSNGYQNSQIDIKIIKDGDNSYPQSDIFKLTGGSIGFKYSSGKLNYTYLGHDYELGTWLGVGMRLDATSGNIILTPTNNTDLTATVEPTSYSITLEGAFTPGDITSFQVKRDSSAPGYSLKFQVTDTMVFLNTYNTVMIDPSLEITDWFPSYTDYRLNFYSFALIGDSITINGQVCPVNRDNGTFTFENVAGFQITKKLENFYITFLDGHTYITFANDGSEYDLGETTDTTVSFDGMWYFTTGLWQTYLGTETYWNWDLSGFQATAGECLLIFLGIIGAGVIIYIVWGKGKLGFLDWLVIIFAVFLATAFLGF